MNGQREMGFLTFAILVIGYLIFVSVTKSKKKRKTPAATFSPITNTDLSQRPAKRVRSKTKSSQRPVTENQKEFFRFFNISITKKISEKDARSIIDNHTAELKSKQDPMLVEWEFYHQILSDLSEPEIRDEYDIKKPSKTLVKQVLHEFHDKGNSYEDIWEDMDTFIDRLLELNPELQRFY